MNDAEVLLANIYSLGEHHVWQECIDHVEPALQTWLHNTNAAGIRRIYIVGCGTSYYAAQVGKSIIEHFTHVPVEAQQAFSFSLYTDPALMGKETLVIGITTTGNTVAVCSALEFARRHGAATLTFTSAAGSKITEIAQTTILTGGKVTIAVKTETYIQSLICLYLLGIQLANCLGLISTEEVENWRAQIQKAEEITHRFFQKQQTEITNLVELYGSTDMIFIVGTGPNYGTAEEASLKVVEMAKMYSVCQEMENFLHGYDRELNENTPVFLLAPSGKALRRMLDFLTFLYKVGVPSVVFTVDENPDVARLADHVIHLKGPLSELATPLVYIAPFYLLGYQLAVKRGFDPSERRFPNVLPLKIRYQDEFK